MTNTVTEKKVVTKGGAVTKMEVPGSTLAQVLMTRTPETTYKHLIKSVKTLPKVAAKHINVPNAATIAKTGGTITNNRLLKTT